MVCKVLLPDGEDACLDQVKLGMASHYKQHEDEQFRGMPFDLWKRSRARVSMTPLLRVIAVLFCDFLHHCGSD
jgi:hypothetical protein